MDTDFDLRRTHPCGALTLADAGKDVVLKGWVDKRRDLGGLIFVDLRDRTGRTQVVFNPMKDAAMHEKAEKLRSEFVIAVKGTVEKRLEANAKLRTGEIEVLASDLRILNEAKTPPVSISDEGNESEDVRLRYRFLDLRRPAMQRNLVFRHRIMQDARAILSAEGFTEVETPILMKSTPEGARDFLVPSRINKGKFYALPQSPQTYKQILMVAGFERYFQVARCFRDEDLRADRQLEFTQIDCELSFVAPDEIYDIFGRFTGALFKSTMNLDVGAVPRLTYQEAMERYGSDKPDIRFDMRMHDLSPIFKGCGFKVFDSVLEKGGVIKGLAAKGCGDFSRKMTDELTEFVKQHGAQGLVFLKVMAEGCEGSAAKFFNKELTNSMLQKLHAEPGDMVFMVAAERPVANTALGQLRLEIGRRKNLMDPKDFKLLWVTNFPLFEFSKTDNRWAPCHHPFTAPLDEDVGLLYGPEYYLARAKAYDLVLNGNEIGGGSIRIHNAGLQSKVFELLGISEKEAEKKFGFLLEAFKYGAPPHGGIAFGLDRMVMIMLGLSSIREVIAFPKTTTGSSPMDECPSEVPQDQLDELGITVKK